MNGKTIRQSLAILALGFVVVTTGCRNQEKEARDLAAWKVNRTAYEAQLARNVAAYEARVARQPAVACYSGTMVDVHTIDRALALNEIRSQYNQATVDEFCRQGLNH